MPALTKGTVVLLGPENSTVHAAWADPEPADGGTVGRIGMVGVVETASIAEAADGYIATHGRCEVQLVGGLTLTIGQTLYLAERGALDDTIGMATNVPPDGSYIIPLGVLKDAQSYIGNAGQLVLMDLQLTPGPRTPSRDVGGFHTSAGGGWEDLITIPLREDTVYLVVVDVAAFSGVSDAGGFRRAVTAKNLAGTVTFDGGQTVLHIGASGDYDVRLLGVIDVLHLQIQAAANVVSAATCRLTATRVTAPPPPS